MIPIFEEKDMKLQYDELAESTHKLPAVHVEYKKNPEKWEIYAWAIRDIMSKASGLPKDDCPQRDKLVYEELLGYIKPSKKNSVKE